MGMWNQLAQGMGGVAVSQGGQSTAAVIFELGFRQGEFSLPRSEERAVVPRGKLRGELLSRGRDRRGRMMRKGRGAGSPG